MQPNPFTKLPGEQIEYLISNHIPFKDQKSLRQVNQKFKLAVDNLSSKLSKPTQHPLLPKKEYQFYRVISDLVAPLFLGLLTLHQEGVISGVLRGSVFYVGQMLAGLTAPLYLRPIKIFAYPVYPLTSNQKSLNWAVPITIISFTTATTYVAFQLSSFTLLKGLAYGINSICLLIFAESPPSAAMLGFTSIRNALQITIFTHLKSSIHLNNMEMVAISKRADILAGKALLVSQIGFMFFTNPIFALTGSVLIATAVKVISMVVQVKNSQPKVYKY